MDRTKESRRSSMPPSTNGFPKRKHRTITLRDSSEEGPMEFREARSKRGMNRDRDSSNRSKKRRGSHSRRDEGEQSTEESVGNEQDDDVQHAAVSRIRSPNTTSFASDHNHRRSLTPAKPPPFKITEEMIGVAVPRKARSASVKRTHESWVSASGVGSGEVLSFRQPSNSPGRQSGEPASPSLNVSVGKMKAIGTVPKTVKSSSSDIEIEIAELLYGLSTSNNQNLEADINHQTSSTDAVPNNSTEELIRIQSEQPADVDCRDGKAACHENELSDVPNESQSCSKSDADKLDSSSTGVMSAVPEGNTQRVGNFEIDLMAPPPEGDDLSRGDFKSESKALTLDLEMKREDGIKDKDQGDRPVKIEKIQEEIEEAKMLTFKEKLDVRKRDVEMPNNVNYVETNNKLEEQDRNNEEPTTSSNPKVEKIAHSSSVPLSTAVSGQSSSLSPIGYRPPLQTVVKTDNTTESSTTPQLVNFGLSQLRPKRCATHYHIARSILHQQFTKMSPLLSTTIGSGSLCGTKPKNVNHDAKQSQKHLPGVDQNGAKEKRLAGTGDRSLTATKSSNNGNTLHSTHRMQFVLQQGPHPGSTGNLVGPAFMLPPAQHQASVVAATNQAGTMNSLSNPSSCIRSQSSVAGSLCTSSNLQGAATPMSFSYPNFSANDSPYVRAAHNNGYPFSYSTASLGATAAIRGASPAPATNIPSGPFYSSQIFHPLQHQQQHPHPQALVQPSYLNASTSSSSSSHKQSQAAQVIGNILPSTTMEQQLQKQHTPQSHRPKHDTEGGGENVPSVANPTSYSQKNMHKQNFTFPVQPLNLSFNPSAMSDTVGGNGGNVGDKQQQRHQVLKGGVETTSSQAFAISFAAMNGTNVPSNLNFSSMPQNPLILQSLPGIAWQGYPAASTPYTTQQKTSSITGEKSGGNSSHQDDEKKTTHCKSSTNGPTTLVFDNSSKNINFVLSSSNGNWPSHAIASTAITSMPFYSNATSPQQSLQLIQLQNQHGMQQQQPAMATRNNASPASTTPVTKFANNAPVFSQNLAQCKSSNQASHSKTTGRTAGSNVHQASVGTSTTANFTSFSQENARVSQGHMQISFGGNYITSQPSQGQQPLNNNQILCTTAAAGTPFNGGNLNPNSEGRKGVSIVSTSQLQQTENSSGGSNSQKSSPVCGRNVPSILSSCPSHLSELKY